MSKKLGKNLYKFPRGKDGGIDISDNELQPKVIIQVKHYTNSTVSNLISSLKKETDKVKKLNPEEYYVFTSLGLSHQRRIEIVEMFSPYMTNLDYIITKEEVNEYLNDTLNRDILNKHQKLWIPSVNILSEFQSKAINIDSRALLNDIEERKELYVRTQAYEKALNKIKNNNILFLLGNPGTGKTTICEMIVLEYLKKDFRILYASSNDLKSVKEAIIQSSEKKQIILLDDFLGQHYLKIDTTRSAELKMLISTITSLENTKLVMNSRVTILNEAVHRDAKFRELHENYSDYELIIDTEGIHENEKKQIFSNHLVCNGIPENYLRYLMKDNQFLNIINHRNFNPRIIEYVTKKKNFIGKLEESYYKFILSKLNNPKDVWQDEFENRIEPIDRIFLYSLYSISEGKASKEDLKVAFEKRISNEKSIVIDKTINNYERIIERLSNSLIKVTLGYDSVEISIINPSLSEYVYNALRENIEEQRMILENAYFYDQIVQAVSNKFLECERIKKLYEENILCYPTSAKSKDIYITFMNDVTTYQVADDKLSDKIKLSLDSIGKNFFTDHFDTVSEILSTLITDKYFEVYDILNFLAETNNLENILSYISNRDYLTYLFNRSYFKNNLLSDRFVSTFRDRFNLLMTTTLRFSFRIETYGIDFYKELKFYSYSKLGIGENINLQNELIDILYDKAKHNLSIIIIREYFNARLEIQPTELSRLIDSIFDKEDIKFDVKSYLEDE